MIDEWEDDASLGELRRRYRAIRTPDALASRLRRQVCAMPGSPAAARQPGPGAAMLAGALVAIAVALPLLLPRPPPARTPPTATFALSHAALLLRQQRMVTPNLAQLNAVALPALPVRTGDGNTAEPQSRLPRGIQKETTHESHS
jgi:hypothetical protein